MNEMAASTTRGIGASYTDAIRPAAPEYEQRVTRFVSQCLRKRE